MRVGVLGTSDVDLVAGVCRAKLGHEVVCADTNFVETDFVETDYANTNCADANCAETHAETHAKTVALMQPRRSLIDAPRLNRLLHRFMQATASGDRGNLATALDAGVAC